MYYTLGMPTSKDFRVRLETKDGCLVANREANVDYYFPDLFRFGRRKFDKDFTERALKGDCITKGVRLISYTADIKTGILAIVEWL